MLCATLQFTHSFTSSTPRHDDEDFSKRQNALDGIVVPRPKPVSLPVIAPRPAARQGNSAKIVSGLLSALTTAERVGDRDVATSMLDKTDMALQAGQLDDDFLKQPMGPDPEPYHFHIFAHKHNTHVTVTRPNREPIVSLSCGNLGFRHSHRKHYDAAYQLGAYVIDRLQQQGWHNMIGAMEVSLRGFGQGREAVTKVLMGTEGSLLRAKVTKVSDSTRLKFGGTRSKNPKRR